MIESENAEAILDEATARLKIYEQRFDPSAGSQLAAINHHSGSQAVSVNPQLYELIKLGKAHSLKQGSNLNIALEPVNRLWQIGFPDAKIPADHDIQNWLTLTDPEKIILDDEQHAVFLSQTGMQLNLNALVKGYVTDLLVTYFENINVFAALIDFDGNLVVFGPSRQVDQQWRIPIGRAHDDDSKPRAIVTLTNKSIITRNLYKRALVKNGQAYSYILNPQTGYPIDTDLTSLTIISDDAIDGAIWSMALLNRSIDDILNFLNHQTTIEGILIDQDDNVFYSQGLIDQLELR